MATIDDPININPVGQSISALGIIGNFILLMIIIYSKKLKDPSYVFVTNIATSDLVTSIQLLIIFTSANSTIPFSDTVGNILCKITYCLFYASYVASTFSLTLISIYRLNIVSNPHRFKQTSLIYKYSSRITVLTWIIGILLVIPLFPVMRYSNSTRICEVYYPYGNLYTSIFFGSSLLMSFVLPGLIMIICYVRIASKISSLTNPAENHANAKPVTLIRSKELAKFYGIITAVYMILSWPFLIILFILSIAEETQTSLVAKNIIMAALFTAAFFASNFVHVLNPIMFMVFDKNIKSYTLLSRVR